MNIIQQNKEKINGILETFDRMIINGYILQLQNPKQFLFYLIQNNIRLTEFSKFAENKTNSLCSHIENYIKENNVSTQYLSSPSINKDELAKKDFEKTPDKTGLISAFSTLELCRTMTVKPNFTTQKLEVVSKQSKCKHYYLYFNDEEFGWMFVRIQTWFPFNIRIYINGREYLSKILDKNDIRYEMYNNSFSYIENFDKAQELANGILNKKLSESFDGIAKKLNCHLEDIEKIMNNSYYWCIDQCEFATDINFKSKEDLQILYKKLVETAFFTFSCEDVYSFFGRNIKWIQNFKKGEITSDLRNRYQGYRIKFKINNNQVKMYDKGNNLRIEVTINNPKEFKVLKDKEKVLNGETKIEKVWKPMGKSISNLYRYVEISKAITKRYIEALPKIDTETVPLKDIQNISKRKEKDKRIYTGFNILNEETLKIFKAISKGEYLISGFNNKEIRGQIYNDSENERTINKTTRLLAKLRAHNIIKKVYKKNKYYLTENGRKIISSILIYTRKELLNT